MKAAIVAALLLSAACATAPNPSCEARFRTRSYYFENDTFAGTDNAYTDGIRFTSLTSHEYVPKWAATVPRPFTFDPHVMPAGTIVDYGWAWGQNMYSPTHLEKTTNETGDRPYGGWLYAGLIAQVTRQETSRHYLEIDIGMVGPSSHAEETQKLIHGHIVKSATFPQGWRYQVGNEPGAVVRYQFDHKIALHEWNPAR